MRLQFFADPAEFLAAAGDHLAAEPVVSTVVTTVAHRTVAHGSSRPDRDWWLAVRDGSGAVVGAGMRTASFEPRPLYLLPMPDEAAVELGRALVGRGEEVLAINGALPAGLVCAEEIARVIGGRVEVGMRSRLHELGELVAPAAVPGRLVAATEADLALVLDWFAAFARDMDRQAGRLPGQTQHALPDRESMLRRFDDQGVWLWLDATGAPVHLTGVNSPAFGVARVGPVYTPPAQRGHGWASNAVAEVSRRLLACGARVCLFTDQANPVSNKVYAALGYRPVTDMADLVIRTG